MSQAFGNVYANAYDSLYRDKDYDGECKLIDQLLRRYAAKPVSRILDLGCGTGGHALRLAATGYEVVGVDRSTDMLRIAKQKSGEAGTTLRYHQADLRMLDLGERFDAVLMMFAVLGYQLDNGDVSNALRAARKHLHPGGLLAFDVWYGPAVLTGRPGDRVRVIENGEQKILRTSSGTLDVQRHVCTVDFRVRQMAGDKVVNETTEQHLMRYFFPQELALFLEVAGFRLLRLGAFPEFDRDADETTWNIMVAAIAV